jgi:hypothetical protein
MAGSVSHIVNAHGGFSMSTIDNLGDANEALGACFEALSEAVAYMPEELYPWGLPEHEADALQRIRNKP